jgi:hypothetical protein
VARGTVGYKRKTRENICGKEVQISLRNGKEDSRRPRWQERNMPKRRQVQVIRQGKNKEKRSGGTKGAPKKEKWGMTGEVEELPSKEVGQGSLMVFKEAALLKNKKAFRKRQGKSMAELLDRILGERQKEMREEEDTRGIGVLHVSSSQEWSCHMSECQDPYHALRECDVFRRLTALERIKRVKLLRLCEGCLTIGHSTQARRCPYKREDEGLCSVKNCSKGHHSLLHMDKPKEAKEGVSSLGSEDDSDPESKRGGPALCSRGLAARNPVQIMTQWIKDEGGGSCLAIWDRKSAWTRIEGNVPYRVTLLRRDGQKVELIAHGLETIASNLDAIYPRVLRRAFPEVPEGGLEGASGRVSLLIGQDNLCLFPVETRRSGGMALFKSQFGTGWIASGNAEKLELSAGDIED